MRALIPRLLALCGVLALGALILNADRSPRIDADILATICTSAANATQSWTFDLWVTAPLLLATILYVRGAYRLRHRAASGRLRTAAFTGGMSVLAVALVSPLHRWGAELFTAHMLEHELVMAIAAPLLVIARPAALLMWGLPDVLRIRVAGLMALPLTRHLWAELSAPLAATALHAVTLWLWHVPLIFESTLVTITIHRLQHLTFLLAALIFWWSMLRCCDRGVAAAHLFVTMLHMSVLGALISLAPHVLFALQTAQAPRWGLSPLEDQQLAGLLMWIPAGTVYAGACIACAAAWIRGAGARSWKAPHATPPA